MWGAQTGLKPPAPMHQQLHTEHQQPPWPEVTLSMGGAGPGVWVGQGWGWLATDLGQLLCPSRLWGEPGWWVAWHPDWV